MLQKSIPSYRVALVTTMFAFSHSLLFAVNKPKEVKTEITITSTPERVWSILMNFSNYPNWNPFIKSVKGDAVKGEKITVHIEPPGAKGMTFKPKVIVVEANKEFRWSGHLLIPGLFDGKHIFEIIDQGNGSVTFVQREQFKGIFVPLLSKMLDTNTKKGFEQMNLKLKELAEK